MTAKQILGNSSDTLRSLAQQYLGDFERWEFIADLNDLEPFESLSNVQIDIPDIADILNSTKATLDQFSGFENLTDSLKTINNWQTIRWI